MKQGEYVAPELEKRAFNCPRCNAYAHQNWKGVFQDTGGGGYFKMDILRIATCAHCRQFSLWIEDKLLYPARITAPLAHKDMTKEVLEYYNEAREISVSSPRSAAALLRLAAKKLCESLGEHETNLNLAIGNLNKKGLPESVIKSLDTVRIVGNEGGAHEGQIDLTGEDNKEIVDKLFRLVNFIVEKTITEPEEVKNMFAALPKDKKAATEKRDERK